MCALNERSCPCCHISMRFRTQPMRDNTTGCATAYTKYRRLTLCLQNENAEQLHLSVAKLVQFSTIVHSLSVCSASVLFVFRFTHYTGSQTNTHTHIRNAATLLYDYCSASKQPWHCCRHRVWPPHHSMLTINSLWWL